MVGAAAETGQRLIAFVLPSTSEAVPMARFHGCVFLKSVNLRLSPHESSNCGSVRMFRGVPGIT
jgi:hypothetical protein